MTPKQALALLRKPVARRIQALAFDANAFERGIVDSDDGRKAGIERQKLRDALQVLQSLVEMSNGTQQHT